MKTEVLKEELVRKWPRARALEVRAIIERLKLCGCGTDAHYVVLLRILDRAFEYDNPALRSDKGFYENEWWEFAAKVADGWNLLEHGTGIGWAWLTDDGKLLREFIHDFGAEDSYHPTWSVEYSWNFNGSDDDSYGEWLKSVLG